MASAADHVDHVRTQLPYAVTVAFIACVTGYIPAGYGVSPIVSLFLGAVLLTAILLVVGKKVEKRCRA